MEPTEDQLREATRKALLAQRDFHVTALNNESVDADHHIVSQTQIESAMRVLWMESR